MTPLRLSVIVIFFFHVAIGQTDAQRMSTEERRRRRYERRGRCPVNRPEPGTRCRRHPLRPFCAYDFRSVPIDDGSGTCVADETTCSHSVECICAQRKWQCENVDLSVDCDNAPEEAYETCTPSDGDSEDPQTEPPSENIFQRECPPTEPAQGASCSLPANDSICNYEYQSIPVYERNGTCLGQTSCVAVRWCECIFGSFQCFVPIYPSCNGPNPDGAFESCSPDAS